jgi:hypothetical protein
MRESAEPVILSEDFMIRRLTTFHENSGIGTQPSPPWGRGWPAPALSSAGEGRVRGSPEASAILMAAKNLGSCSFNKPLRSFVVRQ